jgi:hypothetical protein
VGNYNGTVTVSGNGNGIDSNNNQAPYVTLTNGAKVEGGTVNTTTNIETFTVTNGVAKITVVAPATVNTTTPYDTLAVNLSGANGTVISTQSVQVPYVSQTATSLQLKPANSKIAANGSDAILVLALDQNGVPMLTGTYTTTVTVSGPAYFSGNSQSQQITFNQYGTPGNVTGGTVTVTALASASGTVTLNVTGTTNTGSSLTAGSTTLIVGTPGAAAVQTLSIDKSVAQVGANQVKADTVNISNPNFIDGQITDANGFNTTTSLPSTVNYTVTLNGNTVASGSVPVSSATGAFNIPFGGTVGNSNEYTAGTYTITTTAPGLSNGSIQVTVVPGAISAVTVTPSVATDVAYSNPSQTVTVQLQDAENNNVQLSGVPVSIWLSGVGTTTTTGTTLNGSTAYTSQATALVVNTDGTGKATATVQIPQGVGNKAVVSALATYNGVTTPTVSSGTITEVGNTASAVTVTASQTTPYTAGVNPTANPFTIVPKDNFGDVMVGDVLQITVPANSIIGSGANGALAATDFAGTDGTFNSNAGIKALGNGVYQVQVASSATQVTIKNTIKFGNVGSYTLTVQDISSPSAPTGTVNFSVAQGLVTGFALFDSAGNNVSAATTPEYIQAGSNAQFTLKPVDAAGNVVSADANYTVTLPVDQTTGEVTWRTNLSGAGVSTVTFTAGQNAQTVYLVNNATNQTVSIGNQGQGAHAVNAAFGGTGITDTPVAAPFGSGSTLTGGVALSSGSAPNYTDTYNGSSAVTYTVTVKDSSGNALANQAVYLNIDPLSTAPAGTLSATVVYTNAQGQVSTAD